MAARDATETQIERVRAIVLTSSFSDVQTRIFALNDAAWSDTIEDLSEWEAIKTDFTVIKGDGVEIDEEKHRLEIRTRVRVRLGYEPVDGNGQGTGGSLSFLPGSFSVRKKIVW